jgi:hypothetical protein
MGFNSAFKELKQNSASEHYPEPAEVNVLKQLAPAVTMPKTGQQDQAQNFDRKAVYTDRFIVALFSSSRKIIIQKIHTGTTH